MNFNQHTFQNNSIQGFQRQEQFNSEVEENKQPQRMRQFNTNSDEDEAESIEDGEEGQE